MKMIEIKNRAILNELDKYGIQLEKAEQALAKKQAIAEKLGVANWTDEDHINFMKTVEVVDNWMVNKEEIKKNSAWFDLLRAKDRVEELKTSIEKAEKRLAKSQEIVDAYHAELDAIADLKTKEELQKLEFEQEQKEWAKDGINLEGRYWGSTKSGKRFWIYGNSGYTERSWHCFTLRVDGETIFTSGEFWRAYGYLKRA